MSFSLLESFEIGSAQFSCIKKEKIYKYRSILYECNSYLVQNQYLFNSSNVSSHDIEGFVKYTNIIRNYKSIIFLFFKFESNLAKYYLLFAIALKCTN